MFWRVNSLQQASPVETVLDKHSFTLEELLEEEDIIQECKALNGRLIEFLKKKEAIAKLLSYIVQPVDPSADSKRQFKYPYASCEVLCCEVEAVFDMLVGEQELLGLLFSLLDLPKPLDCMLAGYFTRVLTALLVRRHAAVLAYIKEHPQVLNKLVDQLENTSVAEALVKLIGGDDQTASTTGAGDLQWLCDSPVLQLLLDTLDATSSLNARENAAVVLGAVARSNLSPLTHTLGSANFLDQLLERAYRFGTGTDVALVVDMCIALLERRALLEQVHSNVEVGSTDAVSSSQDNNSNGSSDPSEPSIVLKGQATAADYKLEAMTVSGISQHADRLVKLLRAVDEDASQETPYGLIRPPLGLARLKVAALYSALIATGSPVAEAVIMSAGVVPRCMELFLQFPFNNLLHLQVGRMIAWALHGGSDAFVEYIVKDCSLPTWLATAARDITPTPVPSTTESTPHSDLPATANGTNELATDAEVEEKPERPLLRAGYLGHITRLANKLAAVAESRPLVATLLEGQEQWQDFTSTFVKERNEVENVNAWACGRPTAMELPGIESDTEEAGYHEADLTLEPMPGVSGTLVSRYSAYGDDDDDDEEAIFKEATEALNLLHLGDKHGQPGQPPIWSSDWDNLEDEQSAKNRAEAAEWVFKRQRQAAGGHAWSSSLDSPPQAVGLSWEEQEDQRLGAASQDDDASTGSEDDASEIVWRADPAAAEPSGNWAKFEEVNPIDAAPTGPSPQEAGKSAEAEAGGGWADFSGAFPEHDAAAPAASDANCGGWASFEKVDANASPPARNGFLPNGISPLWSGPAAARTPSHDANDELSGSFTGSGIDDDVTVLTEAGEFVDVGAPLEGKGDIAALKPHQQVDHPSCPGQQVTA